MNDRINNLQRWGRGLTLGLCLGGSALSLSGCFSGTQYASDNSVTAADYHERHPIILGQTSITLDLFPIGGRLDGLSQDKIKGFAEKYRAYGSGEVMILAPAGDPTNAAVAAQIRRQLYADGLRGYVAVGSYPVNSHELASPIRLAFQGLKARVADKCGQWPTDLASGSSIDGWQNQAYPNFGCATQTAIAAQVDDPRDLVQARASTPPDEVMRLRAIEKVRQGADPGTEWKTEVTPIGQVGGG